MEDRSSRKWSLLGEDNKARMSLLADSKYLYNPPRVRIALGAMKKIQCFVHLAQGEINGMGLVEKQGNDLVITDAFILEQEVNPVHAEIDPMALNQYVAQCDDPSKIRFQWHSHVNMAAVFSSEDTATMKGYFSDFMISLVINKAGLYSCRLDLYRPFYTAFEVPISVIMPVDEELIQNCREEMELKVKDSGFSVNKVLSNLHIRERSKPYDDTWDQSEEPVRAPLEDLDFEEGESP